MSQKIVRSALEARLKTWAAAQTPAISVAYQNVPFTPPAGKKYLRAFLIPAEPESLDLVGSHVAYRGIFQISIVTPEGDGSATAETIAAALATLFPNNLKIVKSGLNIFIVKPINIGPAVPESGAYVVPVSIQYRCDTI